MLCEVRSTQLREEWKGKEKSEDTIGRLLLLTVQSFQRFQSKVCLRTGRAWLWYQGEELPHGQKFEKS